MKNGKMDLNRYGEILNNIWQDLPSHYHDCSLDEYIIIPDHSHGIVEIINDENIGIGFIGNGFVGNGFKPFPTFSSADLKRFHPAGLIQ
jgi:hypothetical protein